MKLFRRSIKLVQVQKRIKCIFGLCRQEICRNHSSYTEKINNWESVVGLEVHAQINAQSKLFSSSPAVYGSPTNTEVSYFDAALPGTLPILNKYCVKAAIMTALALKCTIHTTSKFDRKHYFYPDLPAGYQITQQFHPLASNGSLKFLVYDKKGLTAPYQCCSRLKQIQLEQDSGRTFHVKGEKSFVDLNRAGIGLMELVFEPDLRNGAEAAALVKELILILQRINTCTCEMEEGTLRVDANISVNKTGQPLGVRTEVKNMNSLRYISKAIDFEIERQIKILEEGGIVINETRAFDYQTKSTVFMRDKEVLQDYRFMPEPNLPPIQLFDSSQNKCLKCSDDVIDISELKAQMPLLPYQERTTLIDQYKLSAESVDKLIVLEGAKDKFEAVAAQVPDGTAVCDFLLNNLLALLNVRKLSFKNCPLTASQLAEIIELIVANDITSATANDLLDMLLNGDQRSAKEIVEQYNWYLINNEQELEALCREVLGACSKVAKKYRNTGKQRHMTSLLLYLYEKTNNRAPYKESENMFKKLILKDNKS